MRSSTIFRFGKSVKDKLRKLNGSQLNITHLPSYNEHQDMQPLPEMSSVPDIYEEDGLVGLPGLPGLPGDYIKPELRRIRSIDRVKLRIINGTIRKCDIISKRLSSSELPTKMGKIEFSESYDNYLEFCRYTKDFY